MVVIPVNTVKKQSLGSGYQRREGGKEAEYAEYQSNINT